MSEKGYSGMQMFLAFLGGAAAGAVVGLLSAPKSGREMRRQIRDVAQSGRQKAGRFPSAVKSATGRAREAFSESMSEPRPEEIEASIEEEVGRAG